MTGMTDTTGVQPGRVAEVFRGAVGVIARRGWVQVPTFAGNKVCAVMAINAAAQLLGAGEDTIVALAHLEAYLLRHRDAVASETPLDTIVRWNDALGRTQEDVEAALLAAAELEVVA